MWDNWFGLSPKHCKDLCHRRAWWQHSQHKTRTPYGCNFPCGLPHTTLQLHYIWEPRRPIFVDDAWFICRIKCEEVGIASDCGLLNNRYLLTVKISWRSVLHNRMLRIGNMACHPDVHYWNYYSTDLSLCQLQFNIWSRNHRFQQRVPKFQMSYKRRCQDCSTCNSYQGAVSIRKTVLLGMVIPMLKIRRPTGRLIFNMGIAIPGKTVFLIETAPWWMAPLLSYSVFAPHGTPCQC